MNTTDNQRIGDWILTFTGVEFYPFDPRPEDIHIEDIAHALSMQCRYAGHVSQFYSVAEHSVRVAEICPPEDKLWALLHDASEAYLVDLPGPIKRYSQLGDLYRDAERTVMMAVCETFGLFTKEPASVKLADAAMLCVEARALLPVNSWWKKWESCTTGTEREIISTLDPAAAEAIFLDTYRKLRSSTLPPEPCSYCGRFDPPLGTCHCGAR